MCDESREVVQQSSLKGGLGNVADRKSRTRNKMFCLADVVGLDSTGEIKQVTWSFLRRSVRNQILELLEKQIEELVWSGPKRMGRKDLKQLNSFFTRSYIPQKCVEHLLPCGYCVGH